MTDATTTAKEPKRTSADVLSEIEAKLATIDGIATADAFKLGGLIREYGQTMAGESTTALITPLLDGLTKPRKSPFGDEPWR